MQAVPLSQRRCDPYRHAQSPRAYGFAFDGHLWVPARQAANLLMAMCPAFPHFTTKDNPLDWPGAAQLLSWHHWRFDRNYLAQLYGTGTTPPAVTFTGTVPVGCGLQLDVPTGGVRGVAQFRWSARNGDGTDWSAPITTGASVALGNGVTLQFANTGPYSTDNEYRLKVSQWRDQTGHAHHWDSAGSTQRAPVPLVTAQGTAISFDGVDDGMYCTSSLPTDLVGGSDNSFAIFSVARIENTSPSGGLGCIVFFGDGATNRRLHWHFLSAGPQFRCSKQDDAGTNVNVTGGTPDTNIHVLELVHTGNTTTMLVDGTIVFGPTAQDVTALTVNTGTIGFSFLSGAEGNKANISHYEMLTYSSELDATTRGDIRSRLKAPYGI